jgi:hypothetical protein
VRPDKRAIEKTTVLNARVMKLVCLFAEIQLANLIAVTEFQSNPFDERFKRAQRQIMWFHALTLLVVHI